MGCNTCGEQKPKKEACAFTKATVQINNPKELALFRKVVVPASLGDDTEYPPKVGKYCNVILYYEANDQVYLYSSDGIPTRITINIDELKRQIKEVKDDLAAEVEDREAADQEIWTEIETIEAASDVVDVVGTYAELQSYDTSKLHANDLIKVLQDETRDDAITYYRWNGSAFTYVGAEGPYYTASETDTLLAAKQDTLIAGTNIQIAADGKTISATDTTYTHFTGATASTDGVAGLVPAPIAGDEDKVLKGDGTWATINTAANTIFYMNASESGGTRHIYKNPDMTGAATSQEVFDANDQGQVILRISTSVTPDMYSDCYLQNAYRATGDYQLLFLDEKTYRSFDTTTLSADTFTYSARVLQDQLTAGTNIQINGNTISATDTTYANFVGTDGQTAGTAGLVPAPATTDAGEFLKADGTWATPPGTTYTAGTGIDITGSTIAVDTTTIQPKLTAGSNISIDANNEISATDTTYSAFTGATSSVAGAAGLVPAPTTSDPDNYLKGDGTWAALPGANNISSNDWSTLWL